MYGKIFDSLWKGSLGPQWPAWSVFVFLLANSDREGFVDLHPDYISRVTGIPPEQVAEGLKILSEPDANSRSSEHEGRRIIPIDPDRPWGWVIVNRKHYAGLTDLDDLREQARNRKRKERDKSQSVTVGHAPSRQAEAEAEAEAEKEEGRVPAAAFARAKRLFPDRDIELIEAKLLEYHSQRPYKSLGRALISWCSLAQQKNTEALADRNGNNSNDDKPVHHPSSHDVIPLTDMELNRFSRGKG